MTNGNDHPTGRLYGVRATDGGDPAIASSKETEETEEIFTCPDCRRAYAIGFIHSEILREKESRKEEARTAEARSEQTFGQGLGGREETDEAT